jgi:transcriptional regulator with XRE-family HTH domain
MSKRLHQLVKRALDEAATLGVSDLADEIGYHRTTLAKYKEGTREPTPDAALALAAAIRKHGRKLVELADRLEREARAERERRQR